jgi:hypothetical protein
MTPKELTEQLQRRREMCLALAELWATLIPQPCPSEFQLNVWLGAHSLDTMVHSLREAAAKFQSLRGNMTADYLVRFISKTANNHSRKTE